MDSQQSCDIGIISLSFKDKVIGTSLTAQRRTATNNQRVCLGCGDSHSPKEGHSWGQSGSG